MTAYRPLGLLCSNLLLLAVLLGLTACAARSPQVLPSPLVPRASVPAPEPSVPATLPEPPHLEATLFIEKTPAVLDQPRHLLPQASPDVAFMRRADMLFDGGRLHYEAGEMEAARREFDRAIDTLLSAPEGLPGRQNIERKVSDLVEEIHRRDVSGLGAGELPNEPVYDKSPLDDIPELTFPIDPSQRNKVMEELRATVSQLPLEVNDEVLRYIDYFSSGRGRRTLTNGLVKAGRYRPLIQRILDEEGVPQELIQLAQVESAFSPRAVSRKRATGMWQFILSRGREYGLIRTRTTDDRLDPEKATRAAARHLRDLYNQFGDWYLAMAAYNCGPLNVRRAIERTGYADFWELRRRNVLPRETLNYVPIILAITIMAKNPADYGLDTVHPDPPLEYSTVEIKSPTHLALVADVTERPVSEIRELNPALLRTVAPEGYLLRVPKGTAATVVSALEMVPPSQRDTWRIHRVEEGETLATIARRYRASAKRISEVNQLEGEGPDKGNLLLIPTADPRSSSLSGRRTTGTGTRSKTTSKRTSSRSNPSKSPSGQGTVVASKRLASQSRTAQAR